MADQDNHIQLPPTPVDFAAVGTTGQAHDEFPKPGQQPRYDWMRSILIGLLACQSSTVAPTQYRTGTIWFDKTLLVYKMWNGSAWVSLASVIQVGTDGTDVVTLADKLAEVESKFNSIQPKMTYGGYCTKNNTTQIPVPDEITTALGDNTASLRPVVYINGVQADPRKTNFLGGCPTTIILSGGVKLNKNDRYTVMIERFDIFALDDVIAS